MGRARARFRKKKRKLGKNISPQNAKKVKKDKNPIGGYAAYKPSGKWWKKRHFLFSKFDQGIIIESNESWYSVTPEEISHSNSEFFFKNFYSESVILDAFCGVGGNTIQFAKYFKVIAIDIDPRKIEAARHNAKIYNVEQNIEFIVGDYF